MTTLHGHKKTNEKNRVLKSARKLSDPRHEVINLFEKGIFPYKDNTFQIKKEKNQKKNQKWKDFKNLSKYIENESKGINYELFKDYFGLVVLSALAKKLFKIKDKKKNNESVNAIKSR